MRTGVISSYVTNFLTKLYSKWKKGTGTVTVGILEEWKNGRMEEWNDGRM
jgi:hypothetical protein